MKRHRDGRKTFVVGYRVVGSKSVETVCILALTKQEAESVAQERMECLGQIHVLNVEARYKWWEDVCLQRGRHAKSTAKTR